MVRHLTRSFAKPDEFASRPEQTPQADGLRGRVLDRLREAFCGLHGHDSLLQMQQDRMFLKCVSCGHESPGWELREARPAVVADVDVRQETLDRPDLVGARRIA
jgi:hypothetical protein